MKVLLVTDKFTPNKNYKDGGATVVSSLKESLKENLYIMQFGGEKNSLANWRYDYLVSFSNRFEHRIANAEYIAERVKEIDDHFSHIIFLHVSLQFGFSTIPFNKKNKIWTFPMFLSPSYEYSGEVVPDKYKELEYKTISKSQNIITPSYLEKNQLTDLYNVDPAKIHVIPRGVNSTLLKPSIRKYLHNKETLKFCTLGSIKAQKNIIELVELFSMIEAKYNDVELHIIGPIQDSNYHERIKEKIIVLGLENKVFFPGHISHNNISKYLQNFHVHISASKCETFGRSIFETLALGIPNVVLLYKNASYEFLRDLPYVRFVKDAFEAINALNTMLADLELLSILAREIGFLYDDKILMERIAAKVFAKETMIISDYDGTIFYKNHPKKTIEFINKFNSYDKRVICSARPLSFLINEINSYNINVDWLISYSGAVIADSKGNILDVQHLHEVELENLYKISSKLKKIIFDNKIILLSTKINEVDISKLPTYLNIEIYDDDVYISSRNASKLHASARLLKIIDWKGNIDSFGNSQYDKKFLTYFCGQLISNFSN